ncbi:DUF5683 domain-containing protein [Sphingobacterium haloxyli]|uniref:DUF5683 domain-containing protein n=1 Tax=Sphingobacterium haloxyli TaxID=2100533 RepID=A0A2S9J2K2_9SPHI|nr:DUF5683 domain-containing protein [Sphingobacterium haloxyli]PRD47005.1 hypothetical protein C5745_12965 [Sphingobacterium haloxyli]
MRYKFLLFLIVVATLSIRAQERDTITKAVDTTAIDTATTKVALQDSVDMPQDTLGNVQDSVRKETRKERRAREKAEKEHEKYYYKDIKKDSTRLEIEHLSRTAWKRSLILPGWGQYTNKGLWWVKVPIIYGGLVTGYVVFDYWQWYYKKFLDELDYRIKYHDEPNDPDLMNWGTQGLVQQKDYGRRNRDLTILITAGFWGLNVVEAYVDSMLKYRWNIGSDMTMKIRPTLMPAMNTALIGSHALGGFGVTPGIKLTMNLK